MIRATAWALYALALAGCDRPTDQTRRERMVNACIQRDLSPVRCAEAARIAIPAPIPAERAAWCARHSPPWKTAECEAIR